MSKRSRRAEAARQAQRRKRRISWAAGVAVVTAVLGFVVLSGGGDDGTARVAPDFELAGPDGDLVRLSDYRGKPVALVFMHTY